MTNEMARNLFLIWMLLSMFLQFLINNLGWLILPEKIRRVDHRRARRVPLLDRHRC